MGDVVVRWHREDFAEAIWSSTTLKPLEKLVALAFADHARDQHFAFVTYTRLRAVTGLSRDAIARAIGGLVEGGWLQLKEMGAHRSPRYWLRIQQSARQTTETPVDNSQQSGRRTTEEGSSPGDGPLGEASSPGDDTSGPGDGLDLSADLPKAAAAHATEVGAGVAQIQQLLGIVDVGLAEVVAQQILNRNKPDDLARYIAKIPATDLQRRIDMAANRPAPRARVQECPHGRAGGDRITGSGDRVSRVCGQCEADRPASREAVA